MNNRNCLKITLIILLMTTIKLYSFSQKKAAIISCEKTIYNLSADKFEDKNNPTKPTFNKRYTYPIIKHAKYIIPKWDLGNEQTNITSEEISSWIKTIIK